MDEHEHIPGHLPPDTIRKSPIEASPSEAVSVAPNIVGREKYGESPLNPRMERELTALLGLAERHGASVEFIPVGEAGYVARMEKNPRVIDGRTIEYEQAWEGISSTKPIVAVDADDTLFAYTETKKPRDDAFAKFATDELGIIRNSGIYRNAGII